MDLTEEQQKDIQERRDSFLKEYNDLCEKYMMEHVSGPVLTTVGANLFAITLVSDIRDTKYLPQKSPISV